MNDISLYENVPSQENNFSVKFRIYKKNSALVPHWHEHFEILYFIKGKCDFICGGKTISASQGDCIIANSTDVHSFVAKEMLEYYCLLIYPAFFSDIGFHGVKLDNLVRCDSFVKECMEDIRYDYEELPAGAYQNMLIKSHTYKLIAHLLKHHTSSIVTKKETVARETKLKRLNRVIEYISENYGDKITTKDISDMCYLSEAHFCRFFKSEVGKSLTEYINTYRLQKATILLKNTEESISAIAMQVGFDDLNYFSRLFHREYEMNPSNYRKENSLKK